MKGMCFWRIREAEQGSVMKSGVRYGFGNGWVWRMAKVLCRLW